MEAYKLGKVTKNQKIDLHLAFEKVKVVKEELEKSLKRRKEMTIQKNDTQYKEERNEDLCDEGRSNEIDVAIPYLLDKKKILNEQVRALKKEHEIKSIRLCEVTVQKKKDEEEKVMVDDDKRNTTTS